MTYRIADIIYLPGAFHDEESPSDRFREFCEDALEYDDSPVFQMLPELGRFGGPGEFPDPEDVADALRNVPGFLFQAECQMDGHWGSRYYAWLYAPTEADILPIAAKWAASKDRA